MKQKRTPNRFLNLLNALGFRRQESMGEGTWVFRATSTKESRRAENQRRHRNNKRRVQKQRKAARERRGRG